MKSIPLSLSPLIGLLAGCLSLAGETLKFEFQDTPFDEFGVSYAFGDVVNGVVVMDTDSGAFSVTWNAAGLGFLSPMHLTLHMINPTAEGMVSITGFWNGEGDPTSVTFNSWDDGFVPLASLTNWEAGQTVYTNGSFDDFDYVSGAYSPDFVIVDSIKVSGTLELSQISLPVPTDNPPESPVNDVDSDGVSDDVDEWIHSDTSDMVYLLGINTGIPNALPEGQVTQSGYTLADIIQLLEIAAAEDAKNHGQYVQELVRSYKMLVKDGLITQQQHVTLIRIIVEHGK